VTPAVEHGVDESHAGAFAGEAADHLGRPPGLAVTPKAT
jgi:hypothetical protein